MPRSARGQGSIISKVQEAGGGDAGQVPVRGRALHSVCLQQPGSLGLGGGRSLGLRRRDHRPGLRLLGPLLVGSHALLQAEDLPHSARGEGERASPAGRRTGGTQMTRVAERRGGGEGEEVYREKGK
jgi:hypothetical protein